MAIQSIKGQEGTVYVIKGKTDAQTMAQYWANLATKAKYDLVNEAIKIATAEEAAAAKTEAAQLDLYNKQLTELRKRRDQIMKTADSYLKDMDNFDMQEQKANQSFTTTVEAYDVVSTTEGGGGSRSSEGQTAAQKQALAETKELRKLQSERQKAVENSAAEDTSINIFTQQQGEDGPLTQGAKSRKKAYDDRIKEIDDILYPKNPDGTPKFGTDEQGRQIGVDKNRNGVIDQDETGYVLPAGSFAGSGGQGTTGGKKTTTTSYPEKVSTREPEDLVDAPTGEERNELLNKEYDAIVAAIEELEGRAPKPQERPTILARAAEIAGRTDVGTPRPMATGGTDETQMADLAERMRAKYFTQPQAMVSQPPTPVIEEQQMQPSQEPQPQLVEEAVDGYTPDTTQQEAPQLNPLPKMEYPITAGQPLPEEMYVNPLGTNQPDLQGEEVIEEFVPEDIRFDNQPPAQPTAIPSELEMFNKLLGEEQKAPTGVVGEKNKQAEMIAEQKKKADMKTKQQVRKEIDAFVNQGNNDWANVVLQLFAPSAEASAMERTRLRDNAYQQLYKTYETDQPTLEKATELLLSLEALEMGALPSE